MQKGRPEREDQDPDTSKTRHGNRRKDAHRKVRARSEKEKCPAVHNMRPANSEKRHNE